jgi:hypothetical protein
MKSSQVNPFSSAHKTCLYKRDLLSAPKIARNLPGLLLALLLQAFVQPSTTFAQDSSVDSVETPLYQPKLLLDFPLLDFPYLGSAARTTANHRLNQPAGASGTVNASDYVRAYNSPSMRQATAITKSVHSTGYFLSNALWYRWVKPTNWKRRLLNRLGANVTAAISDNIFNRYPFGSVWLHEEFHRNTMTLRGISSYNTIWDIGRFTGKVSQVKDEDLIRFKAQYPAEFIRMHAAGIEGQYVLLQSMQKDNFFYQTHYPNILFALVQTKNAVDYVGLAGDRELGAKALQSIQENEGPDMAERDFTGLDLNAWVYDLFRPQEPYGARGIHPSGNGILRERFPNQFTDEEFAYAQKVGKLQYLNFISPHLLSISRIKVSKNFAFNFALRHYLTSFGYDAGGDLFLKIKDKNILFTWHGYHNKDHFFPGVEAHLLDLPVRLSAKTLPLTLRTMLWLQPKDQQFYTDQGQAGGLIYAQLRYPLSRTWQPYLEVEGKTQGWVAGNPFLPANLTVRAGISAYLNFSPKQ